MLIYIIINIIILCYCIRDEREMVSVAMEEAGVGKEAWKGETIAGCNELCSGVARRARAGLTLVEGVECNAG